MWWSVGLLLVTCSICRAQLDTSLYVESLGFDSTETVSFASKVSTLLLPYMASINTSRQSLGFPDSGAITSKNPIPVCVVSAKLIAQDSTTSINSIGKSFAYYRTPLYALALLGSCMDVDSNANASLLVGYPNTTRLIFEARDTIASRENVPRSVFYLTDIPVLNLMFIARTSRSDGSVTLTPLATSGGFALSKGQSYAASEVWRKLRQKMGVVTSPLPSGVTELAR
jgi:hypothetical protein